MSPCLAHRRHVRRRRQAGISNNAADVVFPGTSFRLYMPKSRGGGFQNRPCQVSKGLYLEKACSIDPEESRRPGGLGCRHWNVVVLGAEEGLRPGRQSLGALGSFRNVLGSSFLIWEHKGAPAFRNAPDSRGQAAIPGQPRKWEIVYAGVDAETDRRAPAS